MYITKTATQFTLLSTILLGLLGYNFISAQSWTPPTATPPANNTSAPINIGTSTFSLQQGNGSLVFNRFAAVNAVWSNQYCDAVGGNCFTATSSVGGASFVERKTMVFSNSQNISTGVPNSAMCMMSAMNTGGCDSGFTCKISTNIDGTWRVLQQNSGDCDATPSCEYTCFGQGANTVDTYSWQSSAWNCAGVPLQCASAPGTRNRTVSCVNQFGQTVADSNCSSAGIKPTTNGGGCTLPQTQTPGFCNK